jgi:hypothetical protein
MTLPDGKVHFGETDSQGNSRVATAREEGPVEFTLLTQDRWMQEEINSAHQDLDKYWLTGGI